MPLKDLHLISEDEKICLDLNELKKAIQRPTFFFSHLGLQEDLPYYLYFPYSQSALINLSSVAEPLAAAHQRHFARGKLKLLSQFSSCVMSLCLLNSAKSASCPLKLPDFCLQRSGKCDTECIENLLSAWLSVRGQSGWEPSHQIV